MSGSQPASQPIKPVSAVPQSVLLDFEFMKLIHYLQVLEATTPDVRPFANIIRGVNFGNVGQ